MKAYKHGETRDFETEGAAREWLAETGGLIIGERVLMVRNRYGRADLTGANLTRADLTSADLTGANLTDAKLTGANLRHADLTGADLTGADLTSAKLTGANLTDANLTCANLRHADLTCANLTRADLTSADLTGADGLIEAKTIGTSQRTITAYWNGKELRYLAGCRDANEIRMRSAIDRDYADRDADRIAYHSAITFLHDAFEALMQRHQIGKYAESKETNEREQCEGVKS